MSPRGAPSAPASARARVRGGSAVRRAVVAAAFLAAAVAAPAPTASAGWWDDVTEARTARIDDVRRDPAAWKDVPLLLDARLAPRPAAGLASTKAFDAATWRPVALRDAGAAAPGGSETSSANAPAPAAATIERAFVRRGSVEERRLDLLPPGARFAVRAAVRDVVEGRPLVEILDVTAEGEGLLPEEEARVRRAETLLQAENPVAAESILRQLLAGRDPGAPVRAHLLRNLGRACRDQRRHADAAAAFRSSLELQPGHRETEADLEVADAAAQRAAREVRAVARDAEPRGALVSAGLAIPVPGVAGRLAGPRDEAPTDAPAGGTTSPGGDATSPAGTHGPPAAPTVPVPAPADADPAPPPRRLAGPR